MVRSLSLLLALLLAGPAVAQNTTLTLRDGSRLLGSITAETPEAVVLTTAYGTLNIPPAEIVNREAPAAVVIAERWIIDSPDDSAASVRLRRTVRVPDTATDSFAIPLEGKIVTVTMDEMPVEGWQQTTVGMITLLTIPLGPEAKAGDEFVAEAHVPTPLVACEDQPPAADLCFRRAYTAAAAGLVRIEWQLPTDWTIAGDGPQATEVGLYRLDRSVRRQEQVEITAVVRRAVQ